jgi:hypothetical protein
MFSCARASVQHCWLAYSTVEDIAVPGIVIYDIYKGYSESNRRLF